jgi:uncharacterized Ntn-hydrolase superfamily protein
MKIALSNLAYTYSIVAYDSETGQLGVAVQSHYFGTGNIVPWAEPGVGAVATQSFVEASYGPLGLDLMRAGKTADQALAALLAADPRADVRQVAMIDTKGNVAAHTGDKCIQPAGHRKGANYSAQANLMLKDTVWDAMSEAFEAAPGDLAERMMVALEAAEAEGGDIRGKQSAAMLVVSGERGDPVWSNRLFDLRVDDHPKPLEELRRILNVSRAYILADKAEAALTDESLGDKAAEIAASHFREASDLMSAASNNPELTFWYAVALASSGRAEAAMPLFKQVFDADVHWRDLVPRLVQPGLFPDDQELIRRILERV